MANVKPGSHESNLVQGAFTLLEKHIQDKHKGCECMRLHLHTLRAVTIWAESVGLPHVFSNNGKTIDELEKPDIEYDTPETVAIKAKEALRIFGRKK